MHYQTDPHSEKAADAVIEVEGVPQLRPNVTVLVTEVTDGGWGVGGRALTLEQMKQQFAPSTQNPNSAQQPTTS